MDLYAVRHGHYDFPTIDQITETGVFGNPELNPAGREKIAQLSEAFKDADFGSTFYSSPTLRARQSADILAKKLGVEIVEAPEIKAIELPSNEDLISLYQKIGKGAQWQYLWLNGCSGFESPENLIKRVNKFVRRLRIEHYRTPRIVVITHEEVIWALKTILSNQTLTEATKTSIGYATITRVLL